MGAGEAGSLRAGRKREKNPAFKQLRGKPLLYEPLSLMPGDKQINLCGEKIDWTAAERHLPPERPESQRSPIFHLAADFEG